MQTESSSQPIQAAQSSKVEDRPHRLYSRSSQPRRRHWLRSLTIAGLVLAVVGGTRIVAGQSTANNALTVQVERQQPVLVDLRTTVPRSPDFLGMNVFPATGTKSLDGAYGFMPYDAKTYMYLRSAQIGMLRFPGGAWGEEHTPSDAQINAFLELAHRTHAEPLMQVRLAGSTPQQAAALVSYCNVRNNAQRRKYPGVPFVPVHYWVIGNEPDLIGHGYTVADYVQDFIAFAKAMKAMDPTIKIFGPEISQYNGPDAPPFDSTGTPWLLGFLQGVAAYQNSFHVHLLDGVSVHRYPFGVTSVDSSSLLFATPDEWQYSLPLLEDAIRRTLGVSLPIAITEINTNSLGTGVASLPATALWWADTLGELQEEGVASVDFFAARGLDHPPSLLTQTGQATPLYSATQVYTHMERDVIPLGSGANPISLYASTNPRHTVVTLMLINKTSQQAAVDVHPESGFSSWRSGKFTLPPYSVACLMLRQGHSTRVYLYAPLAPQASPTLHALDTGSHAQRRRHRAGQG